VTLATPRVRTEHWPVLNKNQINCGNHSYIAGTVDSIPLLKVGWKTVYFSSHFSWPGVHKVTKLHRFAHIFSKISTANTLGTPKLWRLPLQTPPSASAHRPTFSELPQPLHCSKVFYYKNWTEPNARNYCSTPILTKLPTKSWMRWTETNGGRVGDSSRGRFFVFSDVLDTKASDPSTTSLPSTVDKLLHMLLNTGCKPDYKHTPD